MEEELESIAEAISALADSIQEILATVVDETTRFKLDAAIHDLMNGEDKIRFLL